MSKTVVHLRRNKDNAVIRKSELNWSRLPKAQRDKYEEISEAEAAEIEAGGTTSNKGGANTPAEVINLNKKIAGQTTEDGNTSNSDDGNGNADGGNGGNTDEADADTNTDKKVKELTLVPEPGSQEEAVVNAYNEARKTMDHDAAIKAVAKATGQHHARVKSFVTKFAGNANP